MATSTTHGPCPRCGGSGYIPAYAHIDDGRCWACGGYPRAHAPKPHYEIELCYGKDDDVCKKAQASRKRSAWAWVLINCSLYAKVYVVTYAQGRQGSITSARTLIWEGYGYDVAKAA